MLQRGIHSPYALAEAHYRKEPGPRTFMEDVQLHLANGYVIGTPWLLALARPVNHLDVVANIVDPSCHYDSFDCWHIYFAAGEVMELVRCLPYPLPWISYERRGNLNIRKTDKLLKLCQLRKRHSS